MEQGWGAPYATILGNCLKPFKCLIYEPKVYHLPKCAEVIHFYLHLLTIGIAKHGSESNIS